VLDLVQPVTTAGALAMRGLETATHALKLQALTPYLWLGRSLMHAPTEEEVEEALVELQLSLRIRHRWLGDLVLLLSAERSGTPVFLPAGSVPDRVRQRVMWATDGSASAMAAGEWLAAFLPAGAAVDLVAVCPPYYGGDRPILEGPDHRAWEHALKVAEAALPDRVRIERHLVEGEPGPALLALGQRLHPTLMVLGMKHRHVGANRLMGSVLQYLLARATWPVLAVPVETALVHQPGSQKAALTDGYPASP
ncbi:MAG: universal stress protein, partial [Clostridia bacterium]